MSESSGSVNEGDVFLRPSAPRLTAEVKAIEGDQAMCRLRGEGGRAFAFLRPVPVGLLAGWPKDGAHV